MTDRDGICFDMDGVLLQSEEYWTAAQREHILPRAAPDDDVPLSAIQGRDFREIYPELAAEYDLAVDRPAFEALFRDAGERIYGEKATLLPEAHDLLTALSAAGVPLALTTSAPREWIGVVDERFDLLEHFDAVVSADDLEGPGKPAPGIYERGAAELGVAPDSCTAIEDSESGVEAATAAGMFTIGFRASAADDTDLSRADTVVVGGQELRTVLL